MFGYFYCIARLPQIVKTFMKCVCVRGNLAFLKELNSVSEAFWTVLFAATKGQLLSKRDLSDPRGRQAVWTNLSFVGQDRHSLLQHD